MSLVRDGKKGAVIVGVGETTYYKRGTSPDSEFKLCLSAILRACEDCGLDVRSIDGFASYADDANTATRVANALGLKELRFSNMVWGGGGGGGCAAVANAAAAVTAGYADYVVVYRAISQGTRRFGAGSTGGAGVSEISGPRAFTVPYGLISPAQAFAMRVVRFMHDYGVKQEALRAISLASYFHAQSNPQALMYGRPLTEQAYDESRWIVEPFHLYDCCMENDGGAAVIVTSAERSRDLKMRPAHILASAQGADSRKALESLHNDLSYASANFRTVSDRLYEQSGVTPAEIDVVQVYENFTGGVLMALIEHGFCPPQDANEFFQLENLIAPDGELPINTSGGNLAHSYMHGLELIIEAARQIRGESTSQIKDANLSMVISSPMSSPVSNLLLTGAEL